MKFSKCAHAAAIFLLGAASYATAADCVNGVNGAGSCMVPAGVTSMTIEAWGGGGGGGSNDKGWDGNPGGGTGGGGGSYCKATVAVVAGNILVVQVGAAGTAGVANALDWSRPGTSGMGGGLSAVTGPGVAGITANGGGGGGSSSIDLVYFSTSRGSAGGGATASSGGAGGAGVLVAVSARVLMAEVVARGPRAARAAQVAMAAMALMAPMARAANLGTEFRWETARQVRPVKMVEMAGMGAREATALLQVLVVPLDLEGLEVLGRQEMKAPPATMMVPVARTVLMATLAPGEQTVKPLAPPGH